MVSNLPPGVTSNMIPGNRPEDARYEHLCEQEIGPLIKTFEAETDLILGSEVFEKLADAIFEYGEKRRSEGNIEGAQQRRRAELAERVEADETDRHDDKENRIMKRLNQVSALLIEIDLIEKGKR